MIGQFQGMDGGVSGLLEVGGASIIILVNSAIETKRKYKKLKIFRRKRIMRNLSVMEQKLVVAGTYRVKSYEYGSGTLYDNTGFYYESDAIDFANWFDKYERHTIVIDESTGRKIWDSEWYR